MNILLINHFAGSKDYGMVFRPYYLSRELLRHGHHITIVAASYSHTRIKNPIVNKDMQVDIIDGISYVWLKTPSYKRSGLGRLANMVIFICKLCMYEKKIGRRSQPDVVIASSTYNLEIYSAKRIARKYQAKLCYEVRDLWPMTPMLIGGYSPKHPFIWVMQKAEDYAYRNCDFVVSLLSKAEPYMRDHGLENGKFYYIPNGIVLSDWNNPMELPKVHQDFFKGLKKNGKTIVGFAGAHGIANSLYAAIDAVSSLKENNIDFVLVGSGPEKENLQRYVKKMLYDNVHFLAPVNKLAVPSLLKEMDILYIGLQKQPLFRFGISPNKLFDYMMAGKPIVQAIDAGNNIVKEAQCGLNAEPDNSDDIKKAILQIAHMSIEKRMEMGNNGKNYVLKNHTYQVLSDRFLEVMNQLNNK